MNLGVYHFKTGNYEAALKEFDLSENETKTPGISLYKAYALEKLNRRDEALKEIESALKSFPGDKGLNELFRAIKESKQNGKGTHSTDGPR
jgi:tetratricopeptide (TPR) repeat protein